MLHFNNFSTAILKPEKGILLAVSGPSKLAQTWEVRTDNVASKYQLEYIWEARKSRWKGRGACHLKNISIHGMV